MGSNPDKATVSTDDQGVVSAAMATIAGGAFQTCDAGSPGGEVSSPGGDVASREGAPALLVG